MSLVESDNFETDAEGHFVLFFVTPLPKVIDVDGALVRYADHYIPEDEALTIFKKLRTHEDMARHATGYTPKGTPYVSDRKSIQISDPGIRAYKFNGSTAIATESFDNFPIVKKLRSRIYQDTGIWSNFCLYTAYTPEAKLGWHSDSETDMLEGSTIVSLSFGDVRRFRVRQKSDHSKVHDFYLKSGSLLTMEGTCQKIMDHCVWDITLKEEQSIVHGLRINLTFRSMKPKR